jgi:hypothetical protein
VYDNVRCLQIVQLLIYQVLQPMQHSAKTMVGQCRMKLVGGITKVLSLQKQPNERFN